MENITENLIKNQYININDVATSMFFSGVICSLNSEGHKNGEIALYDGNPYVYTCSGFEPIESIFDLSAYQNCCIDRDIPKKSNCINCGSAKDIDEIKCPFCGTTYLDFTAIDFSSNDPVVCQFVLPFTEKQTVMQMVAIPHLNEITAEPVCYRFDNGSSRCLSVLNDYNMNVGVSFTPINRKNVLFSLKN